ncbi:MAG: putative protein-disulfide isomerase [Gammaproteobacteria bacterium]|jgi:putative protein-disulfide isomerase
MCSWCWAFRPSLLFLLGGLPKEIVVVRLLGGLAPDSEEPMPDETQLLVQGHWQTIEQQVPATKFNYDFWTKCAPRRSTYLSCRAVIAARNQGQEFDAKMTFAIQQAYYLQARNPSDNSTLVKLSDELGLDKDRFAQDINSLETNETLRQEIKLSRRLSLNSFPSLLLDYGEKQLRINPDYINADAMLEKIHGSYE